MLTPSIGRCLMPLIMSGAGTPVASRMVGTTSMMWWNWRRMPPTSLMWPGHDIATPWAVPPKCDATCLVHLNGVSIAQAQGAAIVRERPVRPPEFVPEELVLDRHVNAVEEGEFVRRAVEHSFGARAVVAADVDDQRVVELTHVLDGLDDPADLMVGVGEVRAVDVGLLDEELLLFEAERIPFRQLLRPGGQLGVRRHDAEPLLVGEDGLAHLVPALVEQVHVADLLDPFRRRMMRRVTCRPARSRRGTACRVRRP